MARLASEAKGGFYPTPENEMRQVCGFFSIELGTTAALLDPCAGEGEALKTLADHLTDQGGRPVTYGIEIEETRAKKCRENLDYAVRCPYETARVTPKAFSILWLNPPYNTKDRDRIEINFLRDLTDPVSGKLMDGGVLGYCIPQYVLASAAPVLAARFDNLQVYRFSDKNFPIYHQVVVFGVRRSRARQGADAKEVREWLRSAATGDLPVLDFPDTKYRVPPLEKKISFRGALNDPVEVAQDLPASPVWDSAKYLLFPFRDRSVLKSPILPLKPAHDAIAIAAGAVGGNLGTHILVGMTKKVTNKEIVSEGEDSKEIEIDRHVTTVRIFTEDGVFDLE